MYRRKIDEQMLTWKNNSNHQPLIVRGVRQCGKSTSVKFFAENHYEHVVYMDFHEQSDLIPVFSGSLKVDYLVAQLSSTIPDAQFIPHHTCIIFDEIQDCPGARASLKFWHLDGRYDIICTGSLLGVNGYRSQDDAAQKQQAGASVPVGFEDYLEMYPMDFEEWLWANHFPEAGFEILRNSFASETPVPEAIHNRMRQLLREYIIIGGMPAAVTKYFETHDVNQVIAVQRGILNGYRTDMIKYALPQDKPRIVECFDSIPRQLSKENKKFQYSVVRKGGRSKEYISCLQWIEDAGIIRRCYNTTITELPLSGNAINSEFKVYMADTGLFISMLDPGTQGDIMLGKILGYKGAIYENIVADILGKMGRPLYYFHKESGLELDFLIRYNGWCTPVECKAVSGNAQSLRTVLKNEDKYHVAQAIKLGDYNVGHVDKLLTLPMYMAFLLTKL